MFWAQHHDVATQNCMIDEKNLRMFMETEEINFFASWTLHVMSALLAIHTNNYNGIIFFVWQGSLQSTGSTKFATEKIVNFCVFLFTEHAKR